ncbi:hypothetical protein ACVWXU_000611 [Streptomyces sp. TE33382]
MTPLESAHDSHPGRAGLSVDTIADARGAAEEQE